MRVFFIVGFLIFGTCTAFAHVSKLKLSASLSCGCGARSDTRNASRPRTAGEKGRLKAIVFFDAYPNALSRGAAIPLVKSDCA